MADFYDAFDKPPRDPTPLVAYPATLSDLTPYVAKVCDTVMAAANGTRNDTLNRAAYTLGRIIGAGQLDRQPVEVALRAAGEHAGLEDSEIWPTMQSGLVAGQKEPRALNVTQRNQSPSVTVLDVAQLDTFWDSRPALTDLRRFARARMCSPWAVLGCALARVIVAIPPFVVLPPIVGSEASLNLFIALVGPSGTGKGAAEAAAADAINVGHIEVAHVGSGEGIAHLYAHREKGAIVRDRDAVLFVVPEVDNLVALTGRQGATLLPQLRMAWSGERLGFAYVDKNKNLPIDRHTYRLGLLLGVQPGRAGPLLDDTDGGTPQRFLWMPTTDPDVPEAPPVAPDQLAWSRPPGDWIANIHGLTTISVPDQARATVLEARRDRLRGDGNTLDGHALLARLKVAAGLALLESRRGINDQDWDLSATVMTVSDHTRAGVTAYLSSKAKASNTARGEAEADRAIVVADKLDAVQMKRVARTITRRLRQGDGDWQTRRDVARTVANRDRGVVDDALGALLDAGQIDTRDDEGKPLYRLAKEG